MKGVSGFVKKLLIANRGEIALRIIRACRELGIKSVAVYSTADAESLHRLLADEAVCIGPPPAAESYLNVPALISAAELTGADAIHPGYGFLAENARFAQICGSCGIKFVGPTPSVIARMGDKAVARRVACEAGIPVVPGSDGPCRSAAEVKRIGAKVGYPLIVKASAGGGGKGMRVVNSEAEVADAYLLASREAKASFGDDTVYAERFLECLRHVEVQVLGDKRGQVVAFPERDCSVQRRHQKLIEESPAPNLPVGARLGMQEAATSLAESVGYEGAGTVEFVYAEEKFYFIEMNTRLQVEHPVTEAITGVDLVVEQIRVASGEDLSVLRVTASGHAIEFRINAEDPQRNFLPQTGQIELYIPPGGPGVRVDSHLYPGYEVGPFYDSLLAKLVVHAGDRDAAVRRGLRSLDEFAIGAARTTIPLHIEVLKDRAFKEGGVSTRFLEERLTSADRPFQSRAA